MRVIQTMARTSTIKRLANICGLVYSILWMMMLIIQYKKKPINTVPIVSKKWVFVLLRSLVMVVLFMIISAIPVLAISDPDIYQINAAYVYRNLRETGDQLYLVEYYCHYETLPSENITTAFQVILYDTDDTTPLEVVYPYAYYRLGYDRGYASIYLPADSALTWGADYSFTIAGREPPFGVGLAPESSHHDIDLWTTYTNMDDTQRELAGRVLYSAYILNNSWNIDVSLLTDTTAGLKLSAYGEAYFSNVISSLRLVAPQAFYYTSMDADNYNINYQGHNYNVYNTGTATFTKGSTTVTGDGTTWTEAMVGREIKPVSEDSWWEITARNSNTELVIASAYPYTTQTDVLYIIGTTHQDSLFDAVIGTPLDLTDLANDWGMSVSWTNSLMTLVFIGVLDFMILKKGGSMKGMIFLDMIVCGLAAVIGMFPLVGAVTFATLGTLLVLYLMFYNKATA